MYVIAKRRVAAWCGNRFVARMVCGGQILTPASFAAAQDDGPGFSKMSQRRAIVTKFKIQNYRSAAT